MSTRVTATALPTTSFAGFMDHAEPAVPQTLPMAEAFSFGDVPRLTAALKRGEEDAFAWLHAQWSRRINRYCFALAAGDSAFAAEIAQGAWLRVVRHMRPLQDESALWNWIACAARHTATDLRRKGGRYFRALGRFAQWWSRPDETPRQDSEGQLLEALDAAMLRLGEEERALVEGRYFSGESLEVIGARHSLSVRAVEGRLARVRQRLREIMAAELRTP